MSSSAGDRPRNLIKISWCTNIRSRKEDTHPELRFEKCQFWSGFWAGSWNWAPKRLRTVWGRFGARFRPKLNPGPLRTASARTMLHQSRKINSGCRCQGRLKRPCGRYGCCRFWGPGRRGSGDPREAPQGNPPGFRGPPEASRKPPGPATNQIKKR